MEPPLVLHGYCRQQQNVSDLQAIPSNHCTKGDTPLAKWPGQLINLSIERENCQLPHLGWVDPSVDPWLITRKPLIRPLWPMGSADNTRIWKKHRQALNPRLPGYEGYAVTIQPKGYSLGLMTRPRDRLEYCNSNFSLLIYLFFSSQLGHKAAIIHFHWTRSRALACALSH